MSSATSRPDLVAARPPAKKDLTAAAEAVRHLFASLSDRDDLRFIFRELAKSMLDPEGESELTICDNEGNVLGFFTPVVCHFRKQPPPVGDPNMDLETFLKGSRPFEEVFEEVLGQRG